MTIFDLKESPLLLYKSQDFSIAQDERIAIGISRIIYFLFSGTRTNKRSYNSSNAFPTFDRIKKVDFNTIKNLVFSGIEYCKTGEKSVRSHRVSDMVLYFNLDGSHTGEYTFSDIAAIRNVKSANDIESSVYRKAFELGYFLMQNGIERLVSAPKNKKVYSIIANPPDTKKKGSSVSKAELLDLIDGAVEEIEKRLAEIKKVRQELAK